MANVAMCWVNHVIRQVCVLLSDHVDVPPPPRINDSINLFNSQASRCHRLSHHTYIYLLSYKSS